jgi:hypothetical protein
MQILVGKGFEQSFGWPVLEVNKDADAVVAYTLVGPGNYASIRYNAWRDVHPGFGPTLQSGRILKAGEATIQKSSTIRWADLAGASVDFVSGKEAAGIWIAHEYARSKSGNSTSDGGRALWVGKILGKSYPDWYFRGKLTVSSKTVVAGSALALSGTLHNGGDGPAPLTSLSPRIEASGGLVTLGVKLALPLQTGASAPIELTALVPVDTPAGTYAVKLVVDAGKTTEEYDELNNTIACDCTVTVLKALSPSTPPLRSR